MADDNLPSLKDLLRNATEAQATQETELHLTARSDESIEQLTWNDGHETGDPRHVPDGGEGGLLRFP